MLSDGGLPDYIADHFRYLVRGSKGARLGQLSFFGLTMVLAIAGPFVVPNLLEHPGGWHLPVIIVVAAGFAASFLWYVSWIHERQLKFRTEMPSSYARWFGHRRRGPFGGMHPGPNLRLVKLQLRYLVLSQEPSPAETLALSLDFARHSLV